MKLLRFLIDIGNRENSNTKHDERILLVFEWEKKKTHHKYETWAIPAMSFSLPKQKPPKSISTRVGVILPAIPRRKTVEDANSVVVCRPDLSVHRRRNLLELKQTNFKFEQIKIYDQIYCKFEIEIRCERHEKKCSKKEFTINYQIY